MKSRFCSFLVFTAFSSFLCLVFILLTCQQFIFDIIKGLSASYDTDISGKPLAFHLMSQLRSMVLLHVRGQKRHSNAVIVFYTRSCGEIEAYKYEIRIFNCYSGF